MRFDLGADRVAAYRTADIAGRPVTGVHDAGELVPLAEDEPVVRGFAIDDGRIEEVELVVD